MKKKYEIRRKYDMEMEYEIRRKFEIEWRYEIERFLMIHEGSICFILSVCLFV